MVYPAPLYQLPTSPWREAHHPGPGRTEERAKQAEVGVRGVASGADTSS